MAGAELAKPAASLTSVMVKRKGRQADAAAAPQPLPAPVPDEGAAAPAPREVPESPAERPVAPPPPIEPVVTAGSALGSVSTPAVARPVATRRTAAAATAVVPVTGYLTWRNAGIVGLIYLAALFIIAAAFNF
jgi:hypothetical protein